MPKIEVPAGRVLRLIEHGPVTLVSTLSGDRPNLAACSWLMPVAPDPPLVGLSIAAGSVTRRNIDVTGELVINVPPRSLAREVHFCGLVSGRDARKDREAGLRLEQAGRVRPPWVAACIGHLECSAREAHGHGDHVLVVAEVLLAVADERLFDEAWITDDAGARTMHHLGAGLYASIGRRVEVDHRRRVDWPADT
jgi:flavin reductase (DIM6/NTAB) family NADH-FMN oxidoreductase RutF